jgi:aspartate kinase
MRIFKFGGASIKDPKGVKNVAKVLQHEGFQETLVVISAMDKMTNAFEKVVRLYYDQDVLFKEEIEHINQFHQDIINSLFHKNTNTIQHEVDSLFLNLNEFFEINTKSDYDFVYDQVVCFGELLSTRIVSAYLTESGIPNTWLDVRDVLITDSKFREAHVDWNKTTKNVKSLEPDKLYIVQGFVGGDNSGNTTTLGREGSDFTAAVFAHILNADNVTIWKDVPGVLNADPRHFNTTELLKQIPYNEAIEMAFYGASVIHPKTLKPLENKKIPLRVRSFYDLENEGTLVGPGEKLSPEIPCFIVKENQILIAVSALDFSFMVEHNIRDIFNLLHRYKLKVNLIQNSAISFSVCLEDNYRTFSVFLSELRKNYKIIWFDNVSLFTVRHANDKAVKSIEGEGEVLLQQETMGTVQMIIRNNSNRRQTKELS